MPCRPTDTLQLPLFPRVPHFSRKSKRVNVSIPTREVSVKPQFFLGHHKRVAVIAVCQWVWTSNHQQKLLEAENKTRVFCRCRRLCSALLLHCHGLVLVLYSDCVPPFPATSIRQARLASGWKKFFGWNWQILLTQFASPLSRDRWQTSACRFFTKTSLCPKVLH